MSRELRGYAGLKSIAQKPEGGFCLVRVRSLLAVWWKFKLEEISLYEIRLYLACLEMKARRCQLKKDRSPFYSEQELIDLVGGGTVGKAKKGIQRLTKAGLLQWDRHEINTDTSLAEGDLEGSRSWQRTLDLVKNNRRKVPLPRRILRHMIKTRHRTLIGAVFAYLFRCLYIRKNRCVSGGRLKTSWASMALGLDFRNCKAAKKQLVQLGWIIPCEEHQTAMNRWGQPVIINLQWDETHIDAKTPPQSQKKSAKTPPPINNQQPLSRSINQKTQRVTGIQNQIPFYSRPCIEHVTIEDLRNPARLDQLYQQATEAGSLPHSESNRLAWFAAAERALSTGKNNPCGLFVSLYRQKLWHHITQEQEDHARAKLKKLDFDEDSHLPGERCGNLPIYDSLAA